mgnify:FL=1
MKTRRTGSRILPLSAVIALAAIIPQHSFGQAGNGIELYNDWKFAEAERALRETVKADPGQRTARYYLGLSALMQEKFGDALDSFLKVKGIQDKTDPQARAAVPSEYQIQLALARARLGLKQYEEAWKHLEAAGAEDGEAADVYVFRGEYYVLQNRNDEAIRELQKAIKMDGKNGHAYYYLGLAYHQAGQAEKAVEALKMFLQLDPHAPEAPAAKKLIDQLC